MLHQMLDPQRKIAQPPAGGMEHGIRYGGGHADRPDLPYPLG
ncbi:MULTISPECIES: hypothetical protein [unclassified Chelatococcus]|nr:MULTISPECIES: hypothetical protein [unclassified Chelatococcus]